MEICPICEKASNTRNTTLLSTSTLEKLGDYMYEHEFKQGSNIYWEGDEADKIYFVKKGTVNLTKMTDDGKDLTFYVFRVGDLFGEFDHTEEKLTSFNAIAAEDCEIGVIQQQDLEVLIWQNGDVAVEFMKWMGYMQRFTQLKLRDLMFYGKNGALASTLIRIGNTYGEKKDNKVFIKKKFTNLELANLIGATRETVNRMLKTLKEDGLIEVNTGKITILDLEELKKICHCEGCPIEICRI
ncbi:Crp/Fnr family transcriptional regulator [Bacillus carboniphilus]|uniref:Crp/Fnr family transcriptional regulator n=1 Tax=Bacillus carboniphilus TaxID=86663 RepID=A0ABY9JSG8_9BACI|nr:Crp/Fnr family transcriptional regulator [Bacillus carboniphilus]WLR41759.1 Crp/Fnr family transcriptional regulator [Bacillus carboniphilus]